MICHAQLTPNNLKDREPQTMKDLVSCFSNQSVRVAPNSRLNACTVTSVYLSRLTSQREMLIRLTWSKNHDGLILTVQLDDLSCDISQRKNRSITISLQLSHKNKGNRTFPSRSCNVDLYWDLSQAEYENGLPEPVRGFYVAMHVESEYIFLMGDVNRGLPNMLDQHSNAKTAETRLVSRKEHVHGCTSYTTKARFHSSEKEHKFSINYDDEKQKLSVSVDDKCVVQAQNLKWNFRANEMMYVGLLPVDMMWDLHAWSAGGTGCATFMFLSRNNPKKSLWQLEEEDNSMRNSFSFTIQMSKGRH